jgi:hypothetical protein
MTTEEIIAIVKALKEVRKTDETAPALWRGLVKE